MAGLGRVRPTYMIHSTLWLYDLQVQPKCSSCEHADCPPSQGGSGLSFTLLLGYGGNNHWALRRTKPPSHSRHVALLCCTGVVIFTSSVKSVRCIYINNARAIPRSGRHNLRFAIGSAKTPPWIQRFPSTSQYLLNYKQSLRILQ